MEPERFLVGPPVLQDTGSYSLSRIHTYCRWLVQDPCRGVAVHSGSLQLVPQKQRPDGGEGVSYNPVARLVGKQSKDEHTILGLSSLSLNLWKYFLRQEKSLMAL